MLDKGMSRAGPELLSWLLDQHAPALVMYARALCSQPEDAVQEALLKLVTLEGTPDDAVAWMYRVVRNTAISLSREENRRRSRELRATDESSTWFTEESGTQLDGEAVEEALKLLPGEQREIVIAKIWGGLTFEQIGELTGTSSSTAHRRYADALASLRERLEIPCDTNFVQPMRQTPKPC